MNYNIENILEKYPTCPKCNGKLFVSRTNYVFIMYCIDCESEESNRLFYFEIKIVSTPIKELILFYSTIKIGDEIHNVYLRKENNESSVAFDSIDNLKISEDINFDIILTQSQIINLYENLIFM